MNRLGEISGHTRYAITDKGEVLELLENPKGFKVIYQGQDNRYGRVGDALNWVYRKEDVNLRVMDNTLNMLKYTPEEADDLYEYGLSLKVPSPKKLEMFYTQRFQEKQPRGNDEYYQKIHDEALKTLSAPRKMEIAVPDTSVKPKGLVIQQRPFDSLKLPNIPDKQLGVVIREFLNDFGISNRKKNTKPATKEWIDRIKEPTTFFNDFKRMYSAYKDKKKAPEGLPDFNPQYYKTYPFFSPQGLLAYIQTKLGAGDKWKVGDEVRFYSKLYIVRKITPVDITLQADEPTDLGYRGDTQEGVYPREFKGKKTTIKKDSGMYDSIEPLPKNYRYEYSRTIDRGAGFGGRESDDEEYSGGKIQPPYVPQIALDPRIPIVANQPLPPPPPQPARGQMMRFINGALVNAAVGNAPPATRVQGNPFAAVPRPTTLPNGNIQGAFNQLLFRPNP
jgi:hypothetical protein